MRKGHELGKWMPVEIEPLLSDPDLAIWHDDQKWWFMALLLRAWGNVENPCHLPNDPDRLRALAGVPDSRKGLWTTRSAAVLAKFGVSSDGHWISNRKQLEVYANQLSKLDARRDAGSKGGKQTASKRVAMLQQSYSSTSISLSDSEVDSSSKSSSVRKIDSEELVEKVMAIGFKDSNRWSKSLIQTALFEEIEIGADPGEMLDKLQKIFTWTNNGAYAKTCFEVIPRWKEPQTFWQWADKKQDRGKEADDAITNAGERLKAKLRSGPADRTNAVT